MVKSRNCLELWISLTTRFQTFGKKSKLDYRFLQNRLQNQVLVGFRKSTKKSFSIIWMEKSFANSLQNTIRL